MFGLNSWEERIAILGGTKRPQSSSPRSYRCKFKTSLCLSACLKETRPLLHAACRKPKPVPLTASCRCRLESSTLSDCPAASRNCDRRRRQPLLRTPLAVHDGAAPTRLFSERFLVLIWENETGYLAKVCPRNLNGFVLFSVKCLLNSFGTCFLRDTPFVLPTPSCSDILVPGTFQTLMDL